MPGLISSLRYDFELRVRRYFWVEAMVRNFPGELGHALRARLLRRYFEQAGDGLRIHEGVRLIGVQQLSVGVNCWIGIDNVIQANGGVVIGDNVMLGPGVKIWSVNHVFADAYRPVHEQGYEHKPVTIGNNVWIGANTFIMPGACIGDGVIVSAGSVVGGKDVEPYAILAGNPARRIGSRIERTPPSIPAPSGRPG